MDRRQALAGFLAAGLTYQTQASAAPVRSEQARLYAAMPAGEFSVPAVNLAQIGPVFLRTAVSYESREPPGTIIIDPQRHFLYHIAGDGSAMRYGVGVGKQGFSWSGVATVNSKQEWPDWYPPSEMLERKPELMRSVTKLRSGIGMHGGPHNPLGARALYLWQNNKDTLFRIHGTTEPWTIGTNASSGCIRMINQDVMDLYERTPVGAKVIVLGAGSRDMSASMSDPASLTDQDALLAGEERPRRRRRNGRPPEPVMAPPVEEEQSWFPFGGRW